MATRCQATNQAGQPCSAQHWQGGWCRWHHPSLEAERREWSRRGGANRSNRQRARKSLPGDLMTVAEVQAAIGRAIRRVEAGELESGPAQALGSLAKTYAALMQVATFEERLTELEKAAGVERRIG